MILLGYNLNFPEYALLVTVTLCCILLIVSKIIDIL